MMPTLIVRKIYRMLSSVVRTDPRKICFISYPDIADNSLELSRRLEERGEGFTLIWLVKDESLAKERLASLASPRTGVIICKAYSLAGLLHALSARIIYHTHGLYTFMSNLERQLVVNLWHGMPLKTIGSYDTGSDGRASRLPIGDIAVATSPLFRDVMAKAFTLPKGSVWLTGQPRTDRLVRMAQITPATTVLWMPTYRISVEGALRQDSGSGVVEDLLRDFTALDAALDEDAPPLFVKLHPMDYLNTIDLPFLEKVKFLKRDDPASRDLEKLMAGAKALITDFSSAAVDFAILQRPVGFYTPDADDYSRGLIPEVIESVGLFGQRLRTVGDIVHFAKDLPQALPAEELGKLHSHLDHGASDRVIDATMRVIAGQQQTR